MASNSITLSASIRQNLLSLQNTTRLLDLTSNRLSTGLKVNSSLDNPAAFFAARSLTNRAGDLSTRKNGIGQAVSLLQSTDKSLKAVTSLVEQAKAKVTEADEAATAGVSTISTKKAITVVGTTTLSTAFSAATAVGDSLTATGGATNTDELIATDRVTPDRIGEIYHLTHAPSQRWYYAPQMTPDEVLLIKGWDSLDDGRAKFTPHSAFDLPDTGQTAPPRESIEVRTLVIIE